MLAYSIRSEVSIILVIDADIAKLISLLVHPSLYHSVCLLARVLAAFHKAERKPTATYNPIVQTMTASGVAYLETHWPIPCAYWLMQVGTDIRTLLYWLMGN